MIRILTAGPLVSAATTAVRVMASPLACSPSCVTSVVGVNGAALRISGDRPLHFWYRSNVSVRRLAVYLVPTLLGAALVSGPALATCGDLNDSASLTSTDALICLQGAVGALPLDGLCEPGTGCNPEDRPCGDVDKDDENDASDCLLILNAALDVVDLATSCDCEGPIDVCAGIEPASGTNIRTERIAQGLVTALYVAAPPLDFRRLVVVLREGQIRLIKNGELVEAPFLDISDKIERGGNEQGLLGLAFHPDYATNGWVFVDYSEKGSGDTVIARYEALPSRDRLDPDSEERVLVIDQIQSNHNGGNLQFGPDGMLWIAMGDGGGSVGAELAQDDTSPLGKLLRVNVDVEESPFWQTPDDNPNPTAPGILGLVWSKGLRNPWRYSFDRETGDLIIGDVGQNAVEEIDLQPADSSGGENYGWNIFEGTSCYSPPCPSPTGFTPPIHEYDHPPGENASVTGGYVYRGCALPDLHGTYFYADFVFETLSSFEIVGGAAVNHRDRTAELQPATGTGTGNVSSFGEDSRGEIYLTDFYDGEVFKIVPE